MSRLRLVTSRFNMSNQKQMKIQIHRSLVEIWGIRSPEVRAYNQIVEKSERWDKYQHEKYGPLGLHKNEKISYTSEDVENLIGQKTESNSWLPNDGQIFRMTWSYLFARAGWILMAYVAMFGFLGLLFLIMYLGVT